MRITLVPGGTMKRVEGLDHGIEGRFRDSAAPGEPEKFYRGAKVEFITPVISSVGEDG